MTHNHIYRALWQEELSEENFDSAHANTTWAKIRKYERDTHKLYMNNDQLRVIGWRVIRVPRTELQLTEAEVQDEWYVEQVRKICWAILFLLLILAVLGSLAFGIFKPFD